MLVLDGKANGEVGKGFCPGRFGAVVDEEEVLALVRIFLLKSCPLPAITCCGCTCVARARGVEGLLDSSSP